MKTQRDQMGLGLGWALLLLVSSSLSAAHPVAEKKPERPEVTPDMTGPYFQGDIMTLPGGDPMRNALLDPNLLWPDGIVVYQLSSSFSEEQKQVFEQAISIYEENTCLRFRERTSEAGYINVVHDPDTTCSSYVGYQGRSQEMFLSDRCFLQIGIVLHEIMHAVGFHHEHGRADRDDWVVINWFNIQEGMAYAFEKYSLDEITHLGTEYDYGSVMHYGPYGFAIDPDIPTIVPIFAELGDIGQREGFSDNDILKINRLYECPQH